MKLLYAMTISVVFAVGAGAVVTQDFDKGVAAYRAGDYAAAVKSWCPLAEQRDAYAQYNLGVMYDDGAGVLQDYVECVEWNRLAAEQRIAPAQNNLAIMHYYGKGVLQDNVRAHMWYNIASAYGYKDAGKWRDKSAEIMTSAAIFEAQKMARECMGSNY